MDGVWSAEGTSPAAIDAALRRLLEERHAESSAYAPARVLNLVAVIDREWRGEIQNRLERVGRYHPSRTIVCAIEPRRTTLDAWATMSSPNGSGGGDLAVGEERVELTIGEEHLGRLETIVDPLLVPDLETLVWSPHGHPEAVDALMGLADVLPALGPSAVEGRRETEEREQPLGVEEEADPGDPAL
jgi:glucose-6-phosphate dehydrogenase assembly protein OpcA